MHIFMGGSKVLANLDHDKVTQSQVCLHIAAVPLRYCESRLDPVTDK